MKVAGRFKPCIHMGCFDLDVFVEMNQRSRKASNYNPELSFSISVLSQVPIVYPSDIIC